MLVDTPVTLDSKFSYPEGSFLWIVNNINFQYFSILITLISAFVMIAVSYATSAPDYTKIQGLTFATQTEANKADTAASWDWKDVTASVIILGCISFAYIYFRG